MWESAADVPVAEGGAAGGEEEYSSGYTISVSGDGAGLVSLSSDSLEVVEVSEKDGDVEREPDREVAKGKEVMVEADLRPSATRAEGPKLMGAFIRAEKEARRSMKGVVALKPLWSASQVPRRSRQDSKRSTSGDTVSGPDPKRLRRDRVKDEDVSASIAWLSRRMGKSMDAFLSSTHGWLVKLKADVKSGALGRARSSEGAEPGGSHG